MPVAHHGQIYVCAADQLIGDLPVSGADCDCDCACAPWVGAEAMPGYPALSEACYRADFASLLLDEQHMVVYNARSGIATLSAAAHRLARQFDSPQPVAQALDRLPNDASRAQAVECLRRLGGLGLLRLADQPPPPVPEQPVVLTAWLHITDRCNLRCSYCYLPHHPHDMTFAVGRDAVDATIRSALGQGFAAIKLKYAGGEALIKLPLIAEIHGYAREQAARHGLDLDGVVLSNGTLLSAAAIEQLRSLGLRLMVSVDGLGATHDQQRPYASGRGSFADAVRGVEQALATGLVPDISITVSGSSVAGLPALMEWVLDRDLPFSLNFYRETKRSAAPSELALDEQRIIAGMLAAYRVIAARLPRRSLLGSLVDKGSMTGPHAHPCGAGRAYLVFDHRGQASACHMQIGTPVAPASAPDTLWLVQQHTTSLANPHVDEKEGCRSCEWRYWCAGGCPIETFRVSGRYDVRSPHCAIYKALFPEAVRLEGLRLLTYARPPL